jgi:hypothetical protein
MHYRAAAASFLPQIHILAVGIPYRTKLSSDLMGSEWIESVGYPCGTWAAGSQLPPSNSYTCSIPQLAQLSSATVQNFDVNPDADQDFMARPDPGPRLNPTFTP